MLAGAWTATGWPATLEGAVLSGHAAAERSLRTLGLHGAPIDAAASSPPAGSAQLEPDGLRGAPA